MNPRLIGAAILVVGGCALLVAGHLIEGAVALVLGTLAAFSRRWK